MTSSEEEAKKGDAQDKLMMVGKLLLV